jgi:hypothetical protein
MKAIRLLEFGGQLVFDDVLVPRLHVMRSW